MIFQILFWWFFTKSSLSRQALKICFILDRMKIRKMNQPIVSQKEAKQDRANFFYKDRRYTFTRSFIYISSAFPNHSDVIFRLFLSMCNVYKEFFYGTSPEGYIICCSIKRCFGFPGISSLWPIIIGELLLAAFFQKEIMLEL